MQWNSLFPIGAQSSSLKLSKTDCKEEEEEHSKNKKNKNKKAILWPCDFVAGNTNTCLKETTISALHLSCFFFLSSIGAQSLGCLHWDGESREEKRKKKKRHVCFSLILEDSLSLISFLPSFLFPQCFPTFLSSFFLLGLSSAVALLPVLPDFFYPPVGLERDARLIGQKKKSLPKNCTSLAPSNAIC